MHMINLPASTGVYSVLGQHRKVGTVAYAVACFIDLLARLDFMLADGHYLKLAKIERDHVADLFDHDLGEFTLTTADFNAIIHRFKSIRVNLQYNYHFGITERLNDVYLGNTCREIPVGYIDETGQVQRNATKLYDLNRW